MAITQAAANDSNRHFAVVLGDDRAAAAPGQQKRPKRVGNRHLGPAGRFPCPVRGRARSRAPGPGHLDRPGHRAGRVARRTRAGQPGAARLDGRLAAATTTWPQAREPARSAGLCGREAEAAGAQPADHITSGSTNPNLEGKPMPGYPTARSVTAAVDCDHVVVSA